MKVLLIFLLVAVGVAKAQTNNPPAWQTVNSGVGNIIFDLPGSPSIVDSADYKSFHFGADSTVAFHILVLKNLSQTNNQMYESIVNAINDRDSVSIISVDSIDYNGIIGISGSLVLALPDRPNLIVFFRLFYYSDRLLNLYIAGPLQDELALLSIRNQFFNSIQL